MEIDARTLPSRRNRRAHPHPIGRPEWTKRLAHLHVAEAQGLRVLVRNAFTRSREFDARDVFSLRIDRALQTARELCQPCACITGIAAANALKFAALAGFGAWFGLASVVHGRS